MTVFTVTVQGPHSLLTSNQRLHWAPKAALTREWRAAAHWAAKAARLPKGLARVHMVVTVFPGKGGRLRDVGNASVTTKAATDGLVDYGLLADDDDAHLVGPDLRRGCNTQAGPVLLFTITELAVAA